MSTATTGGTGDRALDDALLRLAEAAARAYALTPPDHPYHDPLGEIAAGVRQAAPSRPRLTVLLGGRP